jgi:adenylosuccinate synthase
LSYEYGLGHYVTSSDCSINGTASGGGFSAQMVDLTLGLVKFPYMTRVGGGPLPTEFTSENAAMYHAEIKSITDELSAHGIPFEPREGNVPRYDHSHPKIIALMDSQDAILQGAGIRLAGEEYGATTGRLRRTGWTDLELLKRAVMINGPDVILTKADVLRGAREFKLGVGYENMEFSSDPDKMSGAIPIYKSFNGFDEDISKINKFNDLPKSLSSAIDLLEKYTGARVRIISTGPDRGSSIIVK